jgi:hypothetical protein
MNHLILAFAPPTGRVDLYLRLLDLRRLRPRTERV